MNIFVTSPDPTDSAFALDDKRVIKMALESAQLMASAINLHGGKSPYKTTHANHPCAVWTRQSRANYWWLFEHYKALCQAYYDRFDKRHKTMDHICVWADGVYLMPKNKFTPFVNCTEFKAIVDVHEAYKFQMSKKWDEDKRKPKWTKTNPPYWFTLEDS